MDGSKPKRYAQLDGVFCEYLKGYVHQVVYNGCLRSLALAEKSRSPSKNIFELGSRHRVQLTCPIVQIIQGHLNSVCAVRSRATNRQPPPSCIVNVKRTSLIFWYSGEAVLLPGSV